MNLKSVFLCSLFSLFILYPLNLNCWNFGQKVEQWYYTPSNNDNRVKGLNIFGVSFSIIGLLLVKKGIEQTLQAYPEKEHQSHGTGFKIWSEFKTTISRIGGSAMTLIGLGLTAGGVSTLLLNKDIIAHYERFKDGYYDG